MIIDPHGGRHKTHKRVPPIGYLTPPASDTSSKGAREKPPTLERSESDMPVNVPPLLYPELLVRMRNVLGLESHFGNYFEVAKARLRGSPVEVIEGALEGEDNFSNFVSEHERNFRELGLDLFLMSMEALKTSPKIGDKSILAATVLALNEDAFVNQYLMSVLQKRDTVFNLEQNLGFCLFLLQELDTHDLEKLFSLVEFNVLDGMNRFAEVIAKLPDPAIDRILTALVNVSSQPRDSDDHHPDRELIYKFILAIAKELQDAKRKVSVDPLKTVYKMTDKLEIHDMALARLTACDGFKKEDFLAEVISDDKNSRSPRFWAISDLCSNSKKGAAKLSNLILTSDEPSLVNYAVYKLVTGNDKIGKNIVAEAIERKIKSNESSRALAFVCSMLGRDPHFTGFFKMLLSREYIPPRGLEDGFAEIKDLKVAKIERNHTDGIVFNYDEDQNPISIIDVFEKLGIGTILEWAIEEQLSDSTKDTHIEENMVRLFIYAYKHYPVEMNSLMAVTLLETKRTNVRAHDYLLALAEHTEVETLDASTAAVLDKMGFDLTDEKIA